MNAARPLALAGIVALGVFYLYVGLLANRPQVGALYRLHFIEQNLREWNHGKGPEYRLGESIDFGRDQPYLSRRGWGRTEEPGTWSDGPSSEVILRIVEPQPPRRLTMTVIPFIATTQGLPSQTLAVYANDRQVGVYTLTEARDMSIDLPAVDLSEVDGLLRLRFEFARANSPKNLGLSGDGRQLGIRLVRLAVE